MTETIRLRVKPSLIPINASLAIGTVTTLPAGSPATVTNVGTETEAVFDFGLPEGDAGAAGSPGVVQSVVGGTGVSVDSTDPANPIVSASGANSIASVLDYGAVGDGSTDDTAAFTAALAAEDVLYVPKLTFIVSGLVIPSNKTLFGPGTLKNPNAATVDIVRLDGVHHVTLRDLTFDGNRANQTLVYLDNIACNTSYAISILNCKTTGAARFGLRIANSADAANDTHTFIMGTEFWGCGTYPYEGGGAFWNTAENIDFLGCSFHGNLYVGAGSFKKWYQQTAGNGVQTAFPFYFHITANTQVRVFLRDNATHIVTEKTLTTHFTVAVGDEMGGTVTMITPPTAGETLEIYRVIPSTGIDYETIFPLVAGMNKNVSFTACSFVDNTNGFQLGTVYDLSGAQPPLLAWNNDPAAGTDHYFSVVGCAFESNDFYVGIMPANHATFANNRCHNNGVGNISASLVPQGEYLTITGNVFQGNGGVGIDMGLCRYFTVSGNSFIDCEVFGIELNAVQYGVVSDNLFKNCCTNAALVTAPNRCAIAIVSDEYYGIYSSTRNLLVTNNVIMAGTNQTYGILIHAPGVGYTYDDIWITDNHMKGSGSTLDFSDQSGLFGSKVFYHGNIVTGYVGIDYLPSGKIIVNGDVTTPATIQFLASGSTVAQLIATTAGLGLAEKLNLGASVASGEASRAFNIIDPAGVARIWRYQALNLGGPSFDLVHGTGATAGNAANTWWDVFTITDGGFTAAEDRFGIRRRTGGAFSEALSIRGATLNVGMGTTTPDRRLHSEVDDAVTNAVTYAARLTHTSSGTPAAGQGVGVELEVETTAGNNEVGATIEAVATDVTSTSEDFDLVLKLMAAGAAAVEMGRLKSTGYMTIGPTVADAGVVPAKLIATVQGTAVALSNSSTSAQNIFAAANDTLTVQASTTYRFRAKLSFNTGATTHITSFGLGGTATFTNIEYISQATSTAANTLGTPQMRRVTAAAAAALTATSVAVTTDIWIEGIMRINGAGTIIPQVTFSAGPTGTCETAINSFFELEPIGSNTVAAVGNWA